MKLPEKRDDLKDFEKAAGLSVDVIVSVKDFRCLYIGRYIYGIKQWQVNNWSGYHVIIEWWPLPEIGTGNAAIVTTSNNKESREEIE